MSIAGTSPTPTRSFRPAATWIYIGVVVYFVAIRLWFDIAVSPMGDEAYYWIWGQRPQLSYLDHPPLHAWLMGLMSLVLGWSPFAVRALTWVTLGVSFWVLWLMAGHVAPEERRKYFWQSAAIFVSLPVIVVATMPAFHDHLLVMFCLAACYCALRFTTGHEAGQSSYAYLYGAAVLVGLATLTKYNGALLALGLAALLMVRPGLRSLWRTPHPYLAGLVIAAIQLPVLLWNLGTDFASLNLHLAERGGGHWDEPRIADAARFLITMVLPLGPAFLLGIALLVFARLDAVAARQGRALALTVFVVSTACLAVAALFTPILLHWNIVAYASATLLGPIILGRGWLRWPHIALGMYLAAIMTWNYAVFPIKAPLFEDGETARNYGWGDVAAGVIAAQREHPDAFLAATDYTYAARLSFQLKTLDVTTFEPIPKQYSLWWTPEEHLGQDALIITDPSYTMSVTEAQFESVTELMQIPVRRNGVLIWTFQIYLAKNYVGPAPH